VHRAVALALITVVSCDAAPARAADGEPKATPPPLDFDLLPPQKPAESDARLARDVARRRQMLTLHQGFGIATWAALAATTVVGQLDLNDRFRGGGDTGRYHPWHKGLAYGTSALFLATGLLAVLAPVPYPKRVGLDTATIHKASMAVATVGMIAQIVLGTLARNQAGTLGERDLARAHQAVGYATLGAMSVGWAVLLF
jgi:hypothetical protein